MKFRSSAVGALALVKSVLGEVKSQRYCNAATSICYASLMAGNVFYGIALPDVKVAPFETIIQIISPITNGWAGFSWGGTMPYNPLTIGWQNKEANTTIYSSRMALGLSLPQPYDAAEYTYLKGTGFNQTHWTLNVRCRGCSQWQDTEGKTVGLDPQKAATTFAHALALRAPAQPANNRSTFNVHTSFARWDVDLSHGKNVDFDKLVAANVIANQPPPVSSTPLPSSTVVPPIGTPISPTNTPVPTQTGIPTSCAGVTNFHSPILTAKGWKAVKVAGNLMQPRGLVLDNAGHLLLIQNGLGITSHTIGPDGCFNSTQTVVTQRNLNHGIFLSQDSKTLYASSATQVYAWDYNAATQSVSATSKVVINGMDTKGHVTRTISIPPKYPNLLIVSHGSNDNFDYEAGNIKTARSCIKAFDLTKTPDTGHNYVTGGYQLGYGLRNGVGIVFDADGMLWEVENASDEIRRTVGNTVTDIHTDNPADELNYIGDPSTPNTQWYGYPTCYTIWNPAAITDHAFTTGDQFVLTPNATFSDTTCTARSTPAKLAFAAHSAPLDAVFSADFTALWVAFHGSWNRETSTGYKVVEVPFVKAADGYRPRSAIAQSKETGYTDVLWNPDEEHCSTTQCFRPVGIAKDRFERMYVTSDSGTEGEMLILGRV
ncbi:cellobiose dehydrogenase-like protein [Byssothecium circinans]|uniref:Cellobiose dehydrogenase-like protein n=1 Tax=Byssothecium circinans TaxID=147558 RepID=A0A6A5UC42_9PLEO|nr:cellobiose dehydrogenase-like protein [Byssothecium circinans]